MIGKKQIYQNLSALESVKIVLAEADKAVHEKTRTIKTSGIPEVLGGVAGGAIGAGISLALLNTAGVAGFSAAGITSGLAVLSVGGGMVAGIFVTTAPVAVLSLAGYAVLSERNKRRLAVTKEAMFQEAVRKQDAILRELHNRVALSEERNRYLDSLNVLLQQVIDNLKTDLGK